ncbi:hypothetical protein KL924_002922 [Ogataea haglerorum]|nr:hypothetical protein KL924_002922 [Ogataea haglerorum]
MEGIGSKLWQSVIISITADKISFTGSVSRHERVNETSTLLCETLRPRGFAGDGQPDRNNAIQILNSRKTTKSGLGTGFDLWHPYSTPLQAKVVVWSLGIIACGYGTCWRAHQKSWKTQHNQMTVTV